MSFVNKSDWNEEYFKAVNREIQLLEEILYERKVRTVYIGGGTPSLVNEEYIGSLLKNIYKFVGVDKNAEITIEINPDSISKEKLDFYKAAGINRVSMGVQAVQERLLKILGRTHSFESVKEAVHLIRKSGFENINLDLIFGIPTQTIDEWDETLDKVIALKSEHLSCYSLEFSAGSEMGNKFIKGELKQMEDDEDRGMYRAAINKLSNAGMMQYEISNFAHRGCECRHNIQFWRGGDYLGVGLWAHSSIGNQRWRNVNNLDRYIKIVNSNKLPRLDITTLSTEEEIIEAVILGLRLNEGIKLIEIEERLKVKNLEDKFRDIIGKLESSGLILRLDNRIVLTEGGRDLENQVALELYCQSKS